MLISGLLLVTPWKVRQSWKSPSIVIECGEFDGDLGEGEGWEFADVFDEEGVEVVVGVFELDGDGFAGEQINAGGEEHDARALIGAEVEDVSE